MNYVQRMINFIEKNNKAEFTHRHIIQITGTNCPYSVLKCLKKYYEFEYSDDMRFVKEYDSSGKMQIVTKRFRKYKIIRRKDNNVKKPCIRGKS